ncbi:MAG: hypothetical protein V2G48_06370 [bacterium JZ-2024 1]
MAYLTEEIFPIEKWNRKREGVQNEAKGKTRELTGEKRNGSNSAQLPNFFYMERGKEKREVMV